MTQSLGFYPTQSTLLSPPAGSFCGNAAQSQLWKLVYKERH